MERRLAAILAADVVGYSRMMGADEAGTLAKLQALRREVIDPAIARTGGRMVKDTGDGVLAEFASAVEAVRCALDVQSQIRLQPDNPMQLRIGINVGDVMVTGDDIHGDGVNVAARLEALAEPGGILVSGIVQETAAGRLDCRFEDIGEQDLKNIARKVRAFRVGVREQERPALALPDKPSLVVLPFQNMSGDPEQEYFVDGLVEDITTALSRIGSLFVIGRNSAFTYKGRAVDLRQVGRELGVRYVLEGSVRRAGARVRITGQLIDATTGVHVWADRFDGALEDVFDLQDRVTANVSGALEPHLQHAEIERAQRKSTQDLGAYDYFLRGMAVLHQARLERMAEAQALFARAFALDPEYGAAYGMAAYCVVFQRSSGQLSMSGPEVAEGARLARLAAATRRNGAPALSFAGRALAFLAGDVEGGAMLVERACALNPNSAAVWNNAGLMKIVLGNTEAALADFERAVRLSPVDPLLHHFMTGMAHAYLMTDRYDDAVAWAERAVSQQPNFPSSLRMRAVAYALSGRLAEARHAMEELLRAAPRMRLSNLDDSIPPYRRPQDRARYVDGLRLAGPPE